MFNLGKDELVEDSHLLLSIPTSTSRQGEKRKSSVPKRSRSISTLEASDNKAQTSGKDSVDDTNIASEAKESHHLITKVSRKRQKIVAPKVSMDMNMNITLFPISLTFYVFVIFMAH